MIEDWDELGLTEGGGTEQWSLQFQEKLGLNIETLQAAIGEWVISHSEELAKEFVNIAPNGDYSKLLEDKESMAAYLKAEASHPQHWKLVEAKADHNLLAVMFDNQIVDEGASLRGFVYVGKSGKIRHAFAQNQD